MSEVSPSNEPVSVFSVDTLIKYMGNDAKALAVVLKIVHDACAPGMQPLLEARRALDEGRLADAGKIFHGLRGSVGTLGAKRLVAASLALEAALADHQAAQIPTLFSSVHAEYAAVLRSAEEWLARNTPSAPAAPA